jgi:hypothetical protein
VFCHVPRTPRRPVTSRAGMMPVVRMSTSEVLSRTTTAREATG